MKCLFRLAALAAVLLLPAAAAASPLWGSDEVRAKRETGEVEALVFDLEIEARRGGQTTRTRQQVTLAPDFSDVAAADGSHRLEDHALCLTLSWGGPVKGLAGHSCHAGVAFRVHELRNRRYLAQVAAKEDKRAAQMVAAEAELGVREPSGPTLDVAQRGAESRYRFGGATVATVSSSAGPASAEEMRRFARFLARNGGTHPQVRAAIRDSGTIPAVIESEFAGGFDPGAKQVMRITNLRRAAVGYPLPGGLASALSVTAQAGTTPYDKAVQAAQTAIAGRTRKTPLEAQLTEAERAASAGRGLEAVLLAMRVTQDHATFASGPQAAENARRFRSALTAGLQTPDGAQLWDAGRLAGGENENGDREAAARFLASARFQDLPYATFRFVTYANLLANSDSKGWDPAIARSMPQGLDNYWVHLAAHPWAANAWKDVGDHLFYAYETPSAWIAYDVGRAVDPDWRAGVMVAIERFEAQLRQNEPDFY